MFDELNGKYGDDFNWFCPDKLHLFEKELKLELNESHNLFGMELKAVAKCESNDNVLFTSSGKFYIVHLTWKMGIESNGFPRYKEFDNIHDAFSFIEKDYIDNYM